MVHKPKHRVHSFRGLLADGGQDEINLERQNVNLAYRVIKFSVMGIDSNENIESVLKIYREEQTSIDDAINFTDGDLLGAALISQSATSQNYPDDTSIIFDNILFSRNIYVTLKGGDYTASVNYYIEIEEVPVGAATLMQLKLGVARKLNLQQD